MVGKSLVARDPLGGVSSAHVIETFITAPPARKGLRAKPWNALEEQYDMVH
jgi:hypothetical protein